MLAGMENNRALVQSQTDSGSPDPGLRDKTTTSEWDEEDHKVGRSLPEPELASPWALVMLY